MWKSVISSSQAAVRASGAHRYPKPSLWTPKPSTPNRPNRTFSILTNLQKETSQENDWNRESLNPQRSEVTKSGTDSDLAQHDSAYDPSNTAPESELEATEQEAQKGKQGSLNMSPANKDIKDWPGPKDAGPARNADKEASSSRGSPQKRRTIHVKEDGTHVSYR